MNDFGMKSVLLILLSNLAENIIVVIFAVLMHFYPSLKIFDTIIACLCIAITILCSLLLSKQISTLLLLRSPYGFRVGHFRQQVMAIGNIVRVESIHLTELA